MELSILSLNCWDVPYAFNNNIRIDLLIDKIQEITPQIIFLQEVISSKRYQILKSKLGSTYQLYPQNISRTNIKNGGLLCLSKIPVIKDSFTLFEDQGPLSLLSLTDRFARKGIQVIETLVKNRKITFVHTHLLCNYNDNEKELKSIKNQINQLVSSINPIQSNPIQSNIILLGDFNFVPHSGFYKIFTQQLGMYDPADSESITYCKNNYNRKRNFILKRSRYGDVKFDYVFTKGIEITNIKQSIILDNPSVVGNKQYHISDHYGLLTEIRI